MYLYTCRYNHIISSFTMKHYIAILLILLSFFAVSAQDQLYLKIFDTDHTPVPYSQIVINKDIQILADKTGIVPIDKDLLHLNDSIIISYLGYKPYTLVVNKSLLGTVQKQVILQDQVYNLDEVKVKHKFNALKFLKKKKKRFLIPYLHNRKVPLEADVTRYEGDSLISQRDSKVLLDFSFSSYADSLLTSTSITDSLSKRNIFFVFKKSSWFPGFYTDFRMRKYFTFKYLGKKDHQYVFLCNWRPQYAGKKYFTRSIPDDRFTIQFELNEDGYITHAQYCLISKKIKRDCYYMDVMYKPYECSLVPYEIYCNLYIAKCTIHIITHEDLH